MTDDAVDVPRMPQRRHRGRRLVLVPQSQDGTPRSIQDRVSCESEGGHSRFASGAGEGLMEVDGGVADHPNTDDVGVCDTESTVERPVQVLPRRVLTSSSPVWS